MPYIDGEKGSCIHKLMYQSNEEFNKKNYELAIYILEEAWEKIDGNKIIYNESFLIVSRILDISIVLKDNARMKKWIDKIFIADPERGDSGERDLWAGKVAYELGELSKASEHFNIATKKSQEHGINVISILTDPKTKRGKSIEEFNNEPHLEEIRVKLKREYGIELQRRIYSWENLTRKLQDHYYLENLFNEENEK